MTRTLSSIHQRNPALYESLRKVNATDNDDWTALILASSGGHAEAMKVLIAGGAEVNATKKDGWTALMSASKGGHTEAIKVLIANGADVNATDKNGWTALMFASNGGHLEAIRMLIAKEAEVNTTNPTPSPNPTLAVKPVTTLTLPSSTQNPNQAQP